MALSPEDKGDVKKHLGKALANKVSKVTRDSKMSKKYGATFSDLPPKKTWVDKMSSEQKAKHSPETLKRWSDDARRAKKDFAKMKSHPGHNLPSTAPASYWNK